MRKIFVLFLTSLFIIGGCETEPILSSTSSASTSVEASSSTEKISFTTNNPWSATASDSWLSIDPSSGGAGDITVTVSITENQTYEYRTGTVTIKSGGLSQAFTYTQEPNQGYQLPTTKFSIGSEGGTITIPIQTNIDYSLSIDEESKGWLSITQTRALTDCRIILTAARNNSFDPREGKAYVSYGGQNTTISITQSQLDELIIDQTSFEIGSEGGEIMIPILTNVEYDCSVLETAGEWITVKNRRTKGLEDYKLVLGISENKNDIGRVGQVKVTGAGKESVLTIVQLNNTPPVPSNQIWYTSTDGGIVTPYNPNGFGANIVTNIYDNGLGVITFDGDVTSIGDEAFDYCDKLTSVVIPETVTIIGDYAFDCCSSLTSFTIPKSVTSIGDGAFEGSDLKSIIIPNNVSTIGSWAFAYCSSLESFYGKYASKDNRCLIINDTLIAFAPLGLSSYVVPEGVKSIGEGAFSYCDALLSITLPDGLSSIGIYAFNGCSGLISIAFPEGMSSIGRDAFLNCQNLTSVIVPESISYVGETAFGFCSNLASFIGQNASDDGRCLIIDDTLVAFAPSGLAIYSIPESVTSIGRYAFYYCENLTSVLIPESVTTIGQGAFSYCFDLSSVTIPSSVLSLENYAFMYCSGLLSVIIHNGVKTIGDGVFERCSKLASISIPESVTSIGWSAFRDCSKLASILLPSGITSIKGYTFWGCSSLSSITISEQVNSIGDWAFYLCDGLNALYMKPIIPPALGSRVFDSYQKTIYVPAGSVDSYRNAEGWRFFGSNIKAMP